RTAKLIGNGRPRLARHCGSRRRGQRLRWTRRLWWTGRIRSSESVKLAVVVQRYGADISGGAELHARYVAERLARHAEVTVLSTCARDYISWKNELPAGEETINGVKVRRFP